MILRSGSFKSEIRVCSAHDCRKLKCSSCNMIGIMYSKYIKDGKLH